MYSVRHLQVNRPQAEQKFCFYLVLSNRSQPPPSPSALTEPQFFSGFEFRRQKGMQKDRFFDTFQIAKKYLMLIKLDI